VHLVGFHYKNIRMHGPLNVKNDTTYFIEHLFVCYIRVNISQCTDVEITIKIKLQKAGETA